MSKLNTLKPLKFFWILMAFYLLNCSVDTTPLFVETRQAQTIGQNDQESIIEIITEQILGFENAIPESLDHHMDQKAQLKKAATTDLFILPNCTFHAPLLSLFPLQKQAITTQANLNTFYFKIPSPPPEA